MRSFIILCCLTIGIVTAANIRADPREQTFDVLEKIDSVLDKELDVLVRESNDETALTHQRFVKDPDEVATKDPTHCKYSEDGKWIPKDNTLKTRMKCYFEKHPKAVATFKVGVFIAVTVIAPELLVPMAAVTFGWRTLKKVKGLKTDYDNEILTMCEINKQAVFGFFDGFKTFLLPGIDGSVTDFITKFVADATPEFVNGLVTDETMDAELTAEEKKECEDAGEDAWKKTKKKVEKYFKKKMAKINCKTDVADDCDAACVTKLEDIGFTGWGKVDRTADESDGGTAEEIGFSQENPIYDTNK